MYKKEGYNLTVTIEELRLILAISKHFLWWRAHDCYHPSEVVAV